MPVFTFVIGAAGTIIIGLIASAVVWDMWTNKIDLSQLLSDKPAASLSRFQFLVFTFTISLSYLLFVITQIAFATNPDNYLEPEQLVKLLTQLPDIPQNVLWLMGISAGSYVAGKGIQKSADTAVAKAQATAAAPRSVAPVAPALARGAIP